MPPLIIGSVLIVSGVLKIGKTADERELADLGVPRLLRRRFLAVIHPWAEIVLGLSLVLLGGVLGLIAALAATALMAGYLWMVAGALRRASGASCSCFGSSRPVTRSTVIRNGWLTMLSAAAAASTWSNPLLGGPVASLEGDGVLWVLMAVAAAFTVALIVRPDSGERRAASADGLGAASDDGERDYVRARTPAVGVTFADGTGTNLRLLARHRPTILLAVSEACGSCVAVIERVEEWRAMLPEVDIRLLVTRTPQESGLTETAEPQTVHDPQGLVSESIGPWSTPSALLLGVDGMLAGGPVSGTAAIAAFMTEIDESLRSVRQAG